MRMSRKPDPVQFFGDDGKPAPDGATSIKGNKLKVAFFFDDAGGPPILIKTGLSAVDVPGARDALAQEVPAWDFDGAVKAARGTWAKALGGVRVSGGTEAQRVIDRKSTRLNSSH